MADAAVGLHKLNVVVDCFRLRGEGSGHTPGVRGLREEEKSDFAHPSGGTLFFTRLFSKQATGDI